MSKLIIVLYFGLLNKYSKTIYFKYNGHIKGDCSFNLKNFDLFKSLNHLKDKFYIQQRYGY